MQMTKIRFAVLLSTFGALLGGCGALSVQADEPQVCEAVPFQLPAVPPPADQISTTVSLSQTLNIPDIPADNRVQANLFINSVDFEAQSGTADLGFVNALRLTADAGKPTCSQVQLVSYDKGSSGNVPSIRVDGPGDDLVNCLVDSGDSSTRKLAVGLTITGHLPSQGATLAMTTCLRAKLTLSPSGK
jgi:hypothetical protein